jgi:hypothetical protein
VIARLLAQPHRVGDERLEQPHQRPPLLHGAAELVHRVGRGDFRIGQRAARGSENRARNRAHGRSDRRLGLQGWFGAHDRF